MFLSGLFLHADGREPIQAFAEFPYLGLTKGHCNDIISVQETDRMAEVTLYHGSVSVIEQPVFGKGKPHNDYGRGFYCTQSLELAKEWAVEEDRDGYANRYLLDLQGLKILDLSQKGFTTLHWITLLLQNRVFTLKNDIIKAGKRYLVEHFSLPVHAYDVIKGYRAEQLRFLGYEAADAATYYPLRKARNEQARMEFLNNRRGVLSPDDLYLADIIRGGIKPDDPRLQ